MAEIVGNLIGSVEFAPSEIAAFPRTQWFSGSGSPADTVGSNGDLYLDGETGDIYQKEKGTWA